MLPKRQKDGKLSINRNRVECKVSINLDANKFLKRINRNIVECKDCCKRQFIPEHLRINRNIVECKAS